MKFGEDVAILAGDGLYAEAFRHLLGEQAGDAALVLAAARELAAATGVDGMVGGQYLDVAGVGETPEELRRLHALKTGRLIGASVVCVLLLAGMDETETTPWRRFAAELGVLFQIVDDILDVTGTDAALGKPSGSDERMGKRTYVSHFGLDGARDLARECHESARASLRRGRADGRDRARADHRLHPDPHRVACSPQWPASSTASTARRTSTTSPRTSSSRSPRRCASTSSTRSARSAGTSAPTSAPASWRSALHSLLDSPKDKIVWDVGHQAYPHKVLTGRRDQLPTIRQYEGLAPFCSIEESEHDIMGAGHASTSIGYAVGLKEGMRLRGEPDAGKVVAVIGDGAMTGGVAFEAIHQAGGLGTPIVVVLNDNGMSIAPNVGALSRYFNRVRLNPKLWHAREGVEHKLTELPGGIGARLRAPRPAAEGVDQVLLGARACCGRSSTGPTPASSTATTCPACGARCARRWPPTGPSSSTSPP